MTTASQLQLLTTLLRTTHCKITAEGIPSSLHCAIAEFLQLEDKARQTCRIARLLSLSGIQKSHIRTFQDFDWNFNSHVPKQDILKFRDSDWVLQAKNLVMIGNPGIGKSHIAKALCYEAILAGNSACFITAFDLISKIKKSPSLDTKINYYAKNIAVLCIDELGYVFHDKNDSDLLYHVISKRSESASTIITSNLAPKDWGSILSSSSASAILDRLSFSGSFLTWDGSSYRIKNRSV